DIETTILSDVITSLNDTRPSPTGTPGRVYTYRLCPYPLAERAGSTPTKRPSANAPPPLSGQLFELPLDLNIWKGVGRPFAMLGQSGCRSAPSLLSVRCPPPARCTRRSRPNRSRVGQTQRATAPRAAHSTPPREARLKPIVRQRPLAIATHFATHLPSMRLTPP